MAKLIGTDPNQVPSNADLGELAFMDKRSVMGSSFNAYLNSAKTISDASWTKLGFEVNEYNTDDAWSLTDDRFTCQQSGIYLFCATVSFSDASGMNRMIVDFAVNGVYGNRRVVDFDFDGAGNVTASWAVSGSRPIALSIGDYVELYIFGDSTSSTYSVSTSQTFFSGQFVRPYP